MNFEIKGFEGAKITLENENMLNGVHFFDVHVVLEEEQIPQTVTIKFSVPDVDMYTVWSPSIRYDRHFGTDYNKRTTGSRLCSYMPLHALVSLGGKNRMTVVSSLRQVPSARTVLFAPRRTARRSSLPTPIRSSIAELTVRSSP